MEPFIEAQYYHIYNRGAGRNNLFWSTEDFRLFIKKYIYYLAPCIQTYSWCLLHNHFHALISIRSVSDQCDFYQSNKTLFNSGHYHGNIDPEKTPFSASRQLSHFMNSYTRFINKKRNRSGTLIEGPLKRKKIMNETQFLHLVCYIHRNPIHHGIVKNYRDYKYSSYFDFITNRKTFLERDDVLERFGGIKNFKSSHQEFKYKSAYAEDYYLE